MAYSTSKQKLNKMYERYKKLYKKRNTYSQSKEKMYTKTEFKIMHQAAKDAGVKDAVKEIVDTQFYTRKQLTTFRTAFTEFIKDLDIEEEFANTSSFDTEYLDLLNQLSEIQSNLNEYINFKSFRENIDTLMDLFWQYRDGLDKEERAYLMSYMYPQEVQIS